MLPVFGFSEVDSLTEARGELLEHTSRYLALNSMLLSSVLPTETQGGRQTREDVMVELLNEHTFRSQDTGQSGLTLCDVNNNQTLIYYNIFQVYTVKC